MADKLTFGQRWQSLTPKNRMLIAFGGGGVIVIILAIALTPSQPATPLSKIGKPKSSLGLPGSVGGDLTIEKLSAKLEAVTGEQKKTSLDLDATKKALTTSQTQQLQSQNQQNPQAVKELQEIRAELKAVKDKMSKESNLDEALPGQTAQNTNSLGNADSAIEPEAPKLRIIGGEIKKEEPEEKSASKKQIAYIPGGSQFEGKLLNGMDAPTSGVAKKTPVPTVIRIKTDAILPNRFRYDVRECLVVASGYGELSTERVNMQPVSIACIKNDGSVIETKISGYIVGEDGRTGVRGRLISRQGQLIAKSFLAGFAGGVANSMAPTSVPQLNTNPGGTAQYQMPDLSSMAMAGTAKGIAESAKEISKFYLDMAKEMFPVIELDSGRNVTIMLIKGFEMNMNGEKL